MLQLAAPKLSLNSGCFFTINVKLHEDNSILEDGSKRSDQPRKILEEVLFLDRMQKNLKLLVKAILVKLEIHYPCSICKVAHKRK